MVAMIGTSGNLKDVLNYNEKKVQRNRAKLIHAVNFLKEKDDMNFYEKMRRFERLNQLNTRSDVNMLHISVNFHPSEKIDEAMMKTIAERYMEKIGCGDQPYLIYRHDDAGHPHFHVVSTLIRPDCKRIRTQNLGRIQSVKACREIEKEFGLIKATAKKQDLHSFLKPIDPQMLIYGKSETKNAMRNILDSVIDEYKYTSLHELNAVLRQYNMMADRGGVNSRIYRNRGLLYKALDENGNPVGVPIKASDFFNKPTLNYLEKRFELNKEERKQFMGSVRMRIDWILLGVPETLRQFKSDLKKEDIELVIRENEQGIVYGLTYIDFKTKTVLNGSDLGKEYSAKGLLAKFNFGNEIKLQEIDIARSKPNDTGNEKVSTNINPLSAGSLVNETKTTTLLDELMKPEPQYSELPYELRKKRKRKR